MNYCIFAKSVYELRVISLSNPEHIYLLSVIACEISGDPLADWRSLTPVSHSRFVLKY